jgi:beta-glucosidase/6-phospho-beta-glucosidase/beta-galactosidase
MLRPAASAEGVPLKGNFVWNAMDNFEWINGYRDPPGSVHVDFKTQKRTPKLSAVVPGSCPTQCGNTVMWFGNRRYVMSAIDH